MLDSPLLARPAEAHKAIAPLILFSAGPSPLGTPAAMTLLAGCYERFLFGYKCSGTDEVREHNCIDSGPMRHSQLPVLPAASAACRQWRVLPPARPSARQSNSRRLTTRCRLQAGEEDGASALTLHRSFTHAAHKGVVKCATAVGQFAATGGADDLIHLYDLRVRHGRGGAKFARWLHDGIADRLLSYLEHGKGRGKRKRQGRHKAR